MKEVLLSSTQVTLRPMVKEDIYALYDVAQDEKIWKHMIDPMDTLKDMEKYIEVALNAKEQGSELPFVIIQKETNKIIGTTRFMEISLAHKRLEIGHTWLNPEFWRTSINTECKSLLLTYCFDELKLNRVQLKTDQKNMRSQKAIERIGAQKEGVLRNHMIRRDGTLRHSVMYSVIKEDWLNVKKNLKT